MTLTTSPLDTPRLGLAALKQITMRDVNSLPDAGLGSEPVPGEIVGTQPQLGAAGDEPPAPAATIGMEGAGIPTPKQMGEGDGKQAAPQQQFFVQRRQPEGSDTCDIHLWLFGVDALNLKQLVALIESCQEGDNLTITLSVEDIDLWSAVSLCNSMFACRARTTVRGVNVSGLGAVAFWLAATVSEMSEYAWIGLYSGSVWAFGEPNSAQDSVNQAKGADQMLFDYLKGVGFCVEADADVIFRKREMLMFCGEELRKRFELTQATKLTRTKLGVPSSTAQATLPGAPVMA